MTESYDITLNAHGYMVKAGTYQRRQSGIDEARVDRARMFDFYGGAQRAVQLERDRFWSGAGAWPTLDSQGISAGPKRTDTTETVGLTPDQQRWSFAVDGTTYVIQGSHIYKVNATAGAYSGLTSVQTLSGTVKDVALVGGRFVFAYGSAHSISDWEIATGVHTAPSFPSTPSAKADVIGSEAGSVAYAGADNAHATIYVRPIGDPLPSGGAITSKAVDADIERMVLVDGHVWAISDQVIWKLNGSTAADATPEANVPRLGYADDLAFALVHFGRLYTWIGHEVVYYDTSSDSFTGTGLRGRGTLGAASVGTWFVVSILDNVTGNAQLWATDGRGWWLVDEQTSTETKWSYPVSVFGVADNADMLAGRGTTSNQTAVWQFFPRSTAVGLRDSVSFTTSLVDAGERDTTKTWRSVGLELAWPDTRGTSDQVTVELDYSTDGGATWTTAVSQNVAGDGARVFTLSADLSNVSSRWLQLRVTMSSILDWCPVVAGLWAEYEIATDASRKRRWTFAVQCKDQVVTRDGSVDSSGARVLADQLWQAWQSVDPVTFRDVDYDLTGTTYTVRVVGISEEIAKPADAARFADGTVTLTLVEV